MWAWLGGLAIRFGSAAVLERLLWWLAVRLTSDVVRPVVTEWLRTRLSCAERQEVGAMFVQAGEAVRQGECSQAAEILGEIAEEVRG